MAKRSQCGTGREQMGVGATLYLNICILLQELKCVECFPEQISLAKGAYVVIAGLFGVKVG